MIRRGAIAAVICQYALSPPAKTAGLLPRIVLHGSAAAGLAAVLDDARPVAGPPRCAGFPYGQLIVFGCRAGPVVTAGVRFGVCASGVVTAGSRSAVFGSPLQDDLFFYTSLGRHDRGPVTPDVIGLSAAGAAAAARRHVFTLQVDGAALDDAEPLGTVVFQSLPPGAIDPGPGGSARRAPRGAARPSLHRLPAGAGLPVRRGRRGPQVGIGSCRVASRCGEPC